MEVIVLLAVFISSLLIGMPIAFAMLMGGFMYIMVKDPFLLLTIPQTMQASCDSFPLLAVPLFILTAYLMIHLEFATRLFDFAKALLGHIRGGLAYVNIVASIIFAGISGSAAADSAGLGVMEIKAMREGGYDDSFSAAITAASSLIGPIIPPSIGLVVYAVLAEVSSARVLAAGMIPGLLMGLMMGVVTFVLVARGKVKHYQVRRADWPKIRRTFKHALLPGLVPIIIVGGIFSGVITPTESGVVACVYTLIIGFIMRQATLKRVSRALRESLSTTAVVMFLIVGAKVLGWGITWEKIPEMACNTLVSIFGNKILILMSINVLLLFLGCFIEGLAGVILVLPVMIPLAMQLNMDLIQLGVMLQLNLDIGLITPPVALCLYIVADIADVPVEKVTKAIIPFYLCLVIVLFLVTYVPGISLFLPHLLFGQ